MFKKLFGSKSSASEKLQQAGTGSDLPGNAEQLFELGNKVQKTDRKQAIILQEKALPFYKDDSPQRFLLCYNLCTNYISPPTPDFVKAIKYAEMAVSIARRLKIESYEYEIFEANALHNWAVALFRSGDIVKGKRIFKEAIDTRKKTDKKSPGARIYLVHTLTSFSESLGAINEFREALTFLKEAIVNLEDSFQSSKVVDLPDFPETIPDRLAVLLRALVDWKSPEDKDVELAVTLHEFYIAYLKLITNKPFSYWEPLGAAQLLLGHVLGQVDLDRSLKSYQGSLAVYTYLNDYYKRYYPDQLAENYIMIGYSLMLQSEFEKALQRTQDGLLHIKKSKNPNLPMIRKLIDLAGSVQKTCGMILKK